MTVSYPRRQLLVGMGGLALAGAAFAAEPRRSVVDFTRAKLDDLIPLVIAGWSGAEDGMVVPERVDGSIDHGQIVTRRYVGENLPPIMLVVSYHGPSSPDLKVHRPETCYTVAGFSGSAPMPIAARLSDTFTVPAVSFTAQREDRIETVLYWTRVGDRFPQSLSGQRFDFLEEAVKGIRADGLLLRASALGSNRADVLQVLQRFAGALVRAASPSGRNLLLGPAASRLAV